ncbi:MAG: hypothetical protein ACLFR6_04770 [Salinarchaeum sp.]
MTCDTSMDDIGVHVREHKQVRRQHARTVAIEMAATLGLDDERRQRIGTGIDRLATIAPVARVLSVEDPATGDVGLRLIATGATTDQSVTLDDPSAPLGRVATTLTATMANGRPYYVADSWRDRPVSDGRCPYAIGATTRSVAADEPNGDTVLLSREGTTATVCVIDGLGHGEGANRASRTARDAIAADPTRSIETLFEATETACQRTRGVVMAIAQFDWVDEHVAFGSVGNIATHVAGGPSASFVARRGVVGTSAPTPLVASGDWTPTDRLVAHSDGVTNRWDWPDVADTTGVDLARTLIRRFGDPEDDASALAVTDRQSTTDE